MSMDTAWRTTPGAPRALVLAYDAMRELLDDAGLRRDWATRVVDRLIEHAERHGAHALRLDEPTVRELAVQWAGRKVPRVRVAVEAAIVAAAAHLHAAVPTSPER